MEMSEILKFRRLILLIERYVVGTGRTAFNR